MNRRSHLPTPGESPGITDEGLGLRRILWIDDEFDSDNPLIRLLALEGLQVEVAGTGAAGLAKSSAGTYSGIVVDLRLPDMFGLSVLRRLVAQSSVPVLVVTAYYHEPEMEAEALAAGATAFRRKPLIDIHDLRTVLQSLALQSRTRNGIDDSAVTPSEALPLQAEHGLGPNRPADSFSATVLTLSERLADPHLTSLAFVETARLMRNSLSSSLGSSIRLSVPPDPDTGSLPQRVREIIRALESNANVRHTPFEADVETRLEMALGRLGDFSGDTQAQDIASGAGRSDSVRQSMP